VPFIEGGTGGTIILMLMMGKLDWRLTALIIVAGIFTAAVFGEPLAALSGLGPSWYPGIGAVLAFGATFLFGGLLTLLKQFQSSPLGFLWDFFDRFRPGRKP
jgi:hypothetical protein